MFFQSSYVTFRNGHPYFMMRIPSDLVSKFNTKYIRKSLKTQVISDAKMLAESIAYKAKSSFTLMRSGVLSEDQEKAIISSYVFKREKPYKVKAVHLDDLYKLYYAEKSPNWAGRTPGEINAQFEGIVKIIGNLPANNLDRALIISGREKLRERLSVRTVNKYLTLLSSILKWGVKHGYVSRNPAEGLQLELKNRADGERKGYDFGDIQRIIQNLPPKDGIEPFKFFIPLIGMYSGMRREEICQLHAEDIKEVGGVWCFDINDSAGKSLKTKSSDRIVPIHSKLIESGLLTFVESADSDINLWGFKQWKTTWGKQFGNWWSIHFNRKYVTQDPLKVFHSFRHTVADTLKQKGILESVAAGLLGHEQGGITFNRYGKKYLPASLVDAVEMIKYE